MTHPSVEHFTRAMQFQGLAPCPQDGRWEIPTDSDICTEVETLQLLFGFVRTLKPKVVVETGCNVGCASQVIYAALQANGGGHLYTCDTDHECCYAALARCGAGNISVTQQDGLSLVQAFAHLADLYWIYSSEDSRGRELQWIREHGKPGATVLVHDTSCYGYLNDMVRGFPHHVILPGPRGLGVITL